MKLFNLKIIEVKKVLDILLKIGDFILWKLVLFGVFLLFIVLVIWKKKK